MNKVILLALGLALCFISAQALQCYDCKVGFWNLCFTTKTTCETNERCFSGVGKAAGFMNITMKGCLKVDSCNKEETVNFPTNSSGKIYKMTKTCCDTDLCNSAPDRTHVSVLMMTLAALAVKFIM